MEEWRRKKAASLTAQIRAEARDADTESLCSFGG